MLNSDAEESIEWINKIKISGVLKWIINFETTSGIYN